jgi:hypothetical protein
MTGDATGSGLGMIHDLAVTYCVALHHARADAFAGMCHDRFLMTAVDGAGGAMVWDKAAFIARVAGRQPFPGAPSFDILGVDVTGGEIARVHLWVDIPPRRFEDHLGFFRVGGEWKLVTKVFRTMAGPALAEG